MTPPQGCRHIFLPQARIASCLNGSIGRSLRRVKPPLAHQTLRCNSTLPASKRTLKKPATYPERLLIYHAGTGRTVFIGSLKVTTIFLFGFFCLVVAPAHYYAPDEPAWIAGVVLLSGIIPMLFVTYTTASFVNYIHLRLPAFARQSRENLLRYSKNLPKNATVEITTMNIIGKPRVSRVDVVDLYPIKRRLGLANYARDTEIIDSKRPWWSGKPVRQFTVLGGFGRTREEGIWENVARAIKKSDKRSDEKR